MKRLLTLRLRADGCAAAASLNGIALAQVTASGGATALPAHEFLLRGVNRLTLRVDPASVDGEDDVSASTPASASLELCLASVGPGPEGGSGRSSGRSPDKSQGGTTDRVLARADWTMPAPFEVPVDVDLPIDFPRWRWLAVPPLPAASLDAVRDRALQCVRDRVLEFRRGQAEGWFALMRLAMEERALAYGGDARAAQAAQAAFRDRLRVAPDGRPWSWTWPADKDFVLRPEADDRLLTCLRRAGGPALQARSRDGRHAWSLPLRLAWLDEGLHGLR